MRTRRSSSRRASNFGSNRLAARPPDTSLPWQPPHFSVNNAAAIAPGPPTRPAGGDAVAGGACARITTPLAANNQALPITTTKAHERIRDRMRLLVDLQL